MRASPAQTNFGTGEISPLLSGRVDLDRYKSALETCKNYLPTVQGGLIRRPGTYYVAPVKDSTRSTRLMPFEFSTTQAYVLEFGHEYIRFYKDNGPVLEAAKTITAVTNANPAVVTSASHGFANGDDVEIAAVVGMTQINGRRFTVAGVTANTFQLTGINSTSYGTYTSGGTASRVYTVVSPYASTQVFDLKFTQSGDVIYVTHPLYNPRKITRTAHTAWTVTSIDFLDGPYLNQNTTSFGAVPSASTLTPAATTGATTITASSALWVAGDVGRLVRILHGALWGYAKITSVFSTTVANVTVVNAFGATTASSNWRVGLWCETLGYPSTVVFFEDRLVFAGASGTPQRFDTSKTSDYENFAPTDTAGVVADNNAVSHALNANDVNVIRWMTSDEKGLLIGTVGGEWIVRPSSQSEALSATNVSAKRASSYGSANIQPVQMGKATMFVQRAGKKVRELLYFYDVDGFQANDLTLLSEHITGAGLVQLAHQKEPQSVMWAAREDGALAALSYDRDIESLKAGWSRHILGGSSDAGGTQAQVESVAVIPSPDGTSQELWVVVKRWINGATVRQVEYMTALFDDLTEQRDAFFVDCGLTYDSPITITGATKANPVVVTATAHGLSNGDSIRISGVLGMSDLNDETFTVANVAANTFQLSGINGTAYTTYVSGGQARKLVSTISGLWHLEGQSVAILADGAVLPNATVASGAISLSVPSAVVQAGLAYNSDGQLPRLDAGSADGTSLGKTRRAHRVGFLLHRTLGFKIGMNFDELDTVTFRTTSDAMSRAPELFSGILSDNIDATYDFENQIAWRQDQPLPGMILAIFPQLVTQDRG